MSIQEYINQKKELNNLILEFIDDQNESEENYHKIINFLNDHQILKFRNELYEFLVFLSKIINYHYRNPLFSSKIKQLIKSIQTEIKQVFSNFELFNIFKTNLLILPFLFKTQIIIFDEIIFRYFIDEIISNNNLNLFNYLLPECQPFLHLLPQNLPKGKSDRYLSNLYNKINYEQEEEHIKEIITQMNNSISTEITPEFEENRLKGENNSPLCEMIRADSIEEFIVYINKNCISLSSNIQPSIFETNRYLQKHEHTIIEYAAFFGSIQIIKYLFSNNVKIPESIFQYAIHSNNPELINFLEENKQVLLMKENLEEAIKCQHNEIANYIIEHVPDCDDKDIIINEYSLRFYNYELLQAFKEEDDKATIFNLILKYDHVSYFEKYFNEFKSMFSITDIQEMIRNNNQKENNETIQFIMKKFKFEEISENLFQGFKKLIQITIPSSVKKIGKWSFEGCTSLRQVIIEKESNLEIIDDYSFFNCISLCKISLPPTTKKIGKRVFERCLSLNGFQFEDPLTIESIGDNAFKESPIHIKEQTKNEIIINSHISFIKQFNIQYKAPFKISMVGDSSAGKTSIVLRYSNEKSDFKLPDDHKSTIGAGCYTNDRFSIWDTSGDERFHDLITMYTNASLALLIVFDLTERNSFDFLNVWIELLKNGKYMSDLEKYIDGRIILNPKALVVLVGNKCDMNRKVSKEEADKFASENKMSYFEVSAKTGEGVNELFNYIFHSINVKPFYIDI